MLSKDEIVQRLVFHEGCVLKPYRCSEGFLTIGVGRNLETNPLTAEEKRVCGDYMHGITKNAAFYLLRNDISKVLKECEKRIVIWDKLSDDRKYALLDMSFQLGIHGVLQFKKMLGAMGVGNWKEAAEQCLDSKYAKQTPARAKRIARTIETGRFETC
jgi:lysozyme